MEFFEVTDGQQRFLQRGWPVVHQSEVGRPRSRARKGTVSIGVRRGSRRCRCEVETREVYGRRSHFVGEDQESDVHTKHRPRETLREADGLRDATCSGRGGTRTPTHGRGGLCDEYRSSVIGTPSTIRNALPHFSHWVSTRRRHPRGQQYWFRFPGHSEGTS